MMQKKDDKRQLQPDELGKEIKRSLDSGPSKPWYKDEF